MNNKKEGFVTRALEMLKTASGRHRLQRKLNVAGAAQLHKWAKRSLRLGNRYLDQRDNVFFDVGRTDAEKEKITTLLDAKIAAHNAICEAIQNELTIRAARGNVKA